MHSFDTLEGTLELRDGNMQDFLTGGCLSRIIISRCFDRCSGTVSDSEGNPLEDRPRYDDGQNGSRHVVDFSSVPILLILFFDHVCELPKPSSYSWWPLA